MLNLEVHKSGSRMRHKEQGGDCDTMWKWIMRLTTVQKRGNCWKADVDSYSEKVLEHLILPDHKMPDYCQSTACPPFSYVLHLPLLGEAVHPCILHFDAFHCLIKHILTHMKKRNKVRDRLKWWDHSKKEKEKKRACWGGILISIEARHIYCNSQPGKHLMMLWSCEKHASSVAKPRLSSAHSMPTSSLWR